MTYTELKARSRALADKIIPFGEKWTWTTRAELVDTLGAKISALAMEFSRDTLSDLHRKALENFIDKEAQR